MKAAKKPAHPDPEVWPVCPTCTAAYVLRRCFTFTNDEMQWLWQRDCKHKTPPVMAGADNDGTATHG